VSSVSVTAPIATAVALAALATAACQSNRTPTSRQRTAGAPPAVNEITSRLRPGHPVIFLGLDAADWGLLDEYIARGLMPNLGRVVAEGTSGRIRTLSPPLSPLVWTTMMTGTSPLEHGILDFLQFDPVSGQREPITSSERRVPAVWNMATMGGKSSAVFGLWATYPAESIDGVIVSDRLFTFLFKEQAPPPGVVFPESREAWARDGLARAEQGVDFDAVHAYLPWLGRDAYEKVADSDDPYGHPVSALRRMLIETQVYTDLSLQWIRDQHPDLTIVYLQSTDTVGHVFAPYVAPRQPAITQQDFDRYSGVPERFFSALDERIGRYRDAAAANGAVLMIASDHGFYWGEGRPTQLSSVATASAAKWHAPDGVYAIWGPGVPSGPGHAAGSPASLHGDVQQVCATLLALLGLPPGRDVNGDPLEGAAPVKAARADYSAAYRPAPVHAPGGQRAADRAAVENLRSLGYVGNSEGDSLPPGGRGTTRTAASYNNEGVIFKERRKLPQAIEALEKALQIDPHLASAQWNLSDVLYAMGQNLDRSDELLLHALAGGMPDGARSVIGRAIAYQRTGDSTRSLRLMNAAVSASAGDPELWLFRGRYRTEQGDCRGAADDFDRATALAPGNAAAYTASGLARLCLGDRAGARNALEHSLKIDPAQPKVREYLATLKH
jgi:predicted AlkP superfamily phosphohydrolase/phosphomutase/Tfp pilus assembly protein PilF